MRFFVLLLALLGLAAPAFAKPKVAVAPFRGDKDGDVAEAIADGLAGSVKVTKPKATGKAIGKLDLGKELDTDEAKKLMKKLEVDAVVHGKLEKDGKTSTLKVAVFVKGKDEPSRFTVQFVKLSDKFREDVSALIVKKVGDDDDKPFGTTPREPRVGTKQPPDDEPKVVKKKKKKKKKGADDDEDDDRLTAARADLGGFGGVRRLTYTSDGNPPPPVGTRTLAAQFAGEVYPLAFGDTQKGAAGLGLALEYQKTLGLKITLPGTNTNVPIDQQHLSIGARYRIRAATRTAIVIGTDFAKRRYIADRSGLAQPTDLDAPDVNYTAIVPSVGLVQAATPTVDVFGRAGGMLILNTGPIQKADSFGAATVFGFELRGGTDIAFSERVGLRLSIGFSQISFKFKNKGAMAMTRGVTAAADRDIGLAATLGVTY